VKDRLPAAGRATPWNSYRIFDCQGGGAFPASAHDCSRVHDSGCRTDCHRSDVMLLPVL